MNRIGTYLSKEKAQSIPNQKEISFNQEDSRILSPQNNNQSNGVIPMKQGSMADELILAESTAQKSASAAASI